jgi:type I restriction enzyme, R subunit
MVLRPYQVYAVDAIVNQVKNSTNNAYIWHTTGSGKTLTSRIAQNQKYLNHLCRLCGNGFNTTCTGF